MPNKLAVLVGINEYPGCPLENCVNDIRDVRDYLHNDHGWPYVGMRLLVDGRATTYAIKEHLHWLVDTAKAGDTALFYYSGHGAQYAGRGHDQEVDKLNECICPVDFDWSPGRMILDKDFVDLFSGFKPGVKFYWCADSCHSGDLDRSINPYRIRAYPVPLDMEHRIRVAREKGLTPPVRPGAGILNYAFMAGCLSNQTSADGGNGIKNGAFTYCTLRALRREVGGNLNRVCDDAAHELRVLGYAQQPTVDGPLANAPRVEL